MAVRIRLMRTGRKNRPCYRICSFDSRTARGGSPLEVLGHYDPLSPRLGEQIRLDKEKIEKWLGQGAVPSETVRSFCKRLGVALPARKKPARKRVRGVQRKKTLARKLAKKGQPAAS